jgi:hypothetical protein
VNVPVLQIRATNPSAAGATLTSLQLTASGSGNDATGITDVSLYADNNGNGVVDGGDILLTSGTYPSNNGTLILNFTGVIAPSSSMNYLVVYDFSSSAPAGSYQANLVGNNSVTGTGGNNQSLNFTGAPLSGALVSMTVSTATPTFTPSVLPTFTPAFIPTVTPVPTTGGGVLPYPNPVTGPGPVTIQVTLAAPAQDARILIFTTSFRKVNEICLGQVPAGMTKVSYNLTDRWGAPLANGPYYLILRGVPGRSVGKVLISR